MNYTLEIHSIWFFFSLQFLFINIQADREGYIAIMMPKPADWLKVKASLVSLQEYKKMREVSCDIKNAVPCDDTLKETP
jgi:hypothetical protein